MERNSLSNNLKGPSLGGTTMKDDNNNNNNKNKLVKDSWEYCSSDSHGDLLGAGFSWPPRSYTCSFCKREFRSAQALGGHMNVHRRDRARLRQYSPPRDGHYPFLNLNLNPNPNPNPNPNFSSTSQSSSPSTRFPPFTSTLPPLVSSSLSSLSSPSLASPSETRKWVMGNAKRGLLINKATDFANMMTSKALFGIPEFEGECKVFKKAEILTLDLEIGVLNGSKEDLDLELRLGYS